MKLPAVLLAASLAANAALCVWYVSHQSVADAPNQGGSTVADSPPARAGSRPSHDSPLPSRLGHEFLALTPEQLREQLRRSDLPADLVEHLVGARIYARLHARRRELMAEALKTAPPWRLAALKTDRFSILTPEQRRELRELESEARDETLRLLGPAHLDRDGLIAFKYGFVPPAKAVLLDALDRDYANLAAEAKEETRYLKTAGDREREKFLRAEQDRDLAALLTPAEREAYELRVSPTAQNPGFQARIAAFQPTEAEYRALFALQKAADEKAAAGIRPTARGMISTAPRPVASTTATMMMIGGANSQLNDEEAGAALGDARFADWQLAGARHYQSLVRLAAAHNLPAETVKQVATLLTETTNASWRISEDQALSGPEKKAAVVNLAASARAEVAAKLGAGLAESYLKSTGWFDNLGNGMAVQVNGNMTAVRNVDAPPRPVPNATSTTKIAPSN